MTLHASLWIDFVETDADRLSRPRIASVQFVVSDEQALRIAGITHGPGGNDWLSQVAKILEGHDGH